MSTLRQKMIEDMQIRNYSPHTIEAYVRCVAQFAKRFGKSPDLLTPAHVREYQLFLVQQRENSWATLVQTVCALRFFYQQTLGRNWMIDFIPYPKRVKKLPLILSQEEVRVLLEATTNLKHHTILATIYATGLRVSEAAALLVSDIDSSRQMIAVRQGKGRKDRFVMLSPKLLELLRKYWKVYKPRPYLFLGDRPGYPISRDGIGWICQKAAVAARLSKPVTPHTLRHTRATNAWLGGMQVHEVAYDLGHMGTEMTLRHYIVGSEESKRRLQELMDRGALSGALEEIVGGREMVQTRLGKRHVEIMRRQGRILTPTRYGYCALPAASGPCPRATPCYIGPGEGSRGCDHHILSPDALPALEEDKELLETNLAVYRPNSDYRVWVQHQEAQLTVVERAVERAKALQRRLDPAAGANVDKR